MAQISIIQKSDITEAGRFDAEYFQPKYEDIMLAGLIRLKTY